MSQRLQVIRRDNDQRCDSMGVCPLNRLTTTVVDYKDEDEREDDLYM